ncbi:MAG: substrate-binding domain-containing protein [Ilumatobacteraceae bacterium]|nr:substrate-binding domain-containing protein [Ilumatobacteraceae bacterium]
MPTSARAADAHQATRLASARIAGAAVAVGLIASACASSDTDLALNGAGASTQSPITTARQDDFRARTGAELEYVVLGSGAGRALFLAGEVDFAGSDVGTRPRRSGSSTTCRRWTGSSST